MSEGLVFHPRLGVEESLLDFEGATLLLGAVSCGNIGQLAIDLLLCSLVKEKKNTRVGQPSVDKVRE